jgi:hypothetical protein
MAENAHNDQKFREGSTHLERLETEALRQEEVNAQLCLDSTRACIKSL